MIHRNPVVIEFGSESSIGKQQSSNSGPSRGASLSPGPFTVLIEHIISSYRNSDAIHFGSPERPRPSVSSAQPISVMHPNPVTVVIEFRLSIIHRPGPRFAHRSLDSPSESEGAPSTDLVNEIQAFSWCRLPPRQINFVNPIGMGILNPTLTQCAHLAVRQTVHRTPFL